MAKPSKPDLRTPRQRQQDFMETLASAITQWQHVEMHLFRAFAKFSKSPHYLASAIFHSVINFNIKLAMTDAAAQFALRNEPTILAEWNNLQKRLRKRAKRRNDLVHFMLMYDTRPGTPEMYLRPSVFDSTADPDRRYDQKQIDEIRISFGALSRKIEEFANRLP